MSNITCSVPRKWSSVAAAKGRRYTGAMNMGGFLLHVASVAVAGINQNVGHVMTVVVRELGYNLSFGDWKTKHIP